MPEEIIRAASEKAGSDHINIEKQLREIARDKHYWEQKRDRIRLTDRKVEELEQNYAEQLAKIRAERQEILKKAKQEAQQLIADANRQIENTIRTIREAQAEKELTRLARRELDDFRETVEQADSSEKEAAVAREIERIERRRQRRDERKARQGAKAAEAPAPVPEKPREVVVGSKVRMAGQEMVGVVQSVKGNRAQVAFGQILTTVDKSRLTVVSNNEYREATRPVTARTVVSVDISSRKLNFKDHIDVRGMRAVGSAGQVQQLHRRRADGRRGVGVDSPRQGHGGFEGGDPPLPAHGAGGRLGGRRACRPRRCGNYDRDFFVMAAHFRASLASREWEIRLYVPSVCRGTKPETASALTNRIETNDSGSMPGFLGKEREERDGLLEIPMAADRYGLSRVFGTFCMKKVPEKI